MLQDKRQLTYYPFVMRIINSIFTLGFNLDTTKQPSTQPKQEIYPKNILLQD